MNRLTTALQSTAALLLLSWQLLNPQVLWADGKTKAIQETAEWVMQRFGKQAVRETSASLAARLESYVARHGDDFLSAVRNVGPRAFQVVDEAGASYAGRAIGIMSRHGEKGIVNILSRPQALNAVARLGETAETALVKHPSIAEGVLEQFGMPAARALETLGAKGGRQLAILGQTGELAKLGRSDELLSVISRFGEKAMQFVWDHKGTLVISGVMAAFLANPEPFIEGTVQLTSDVATSVIKPLAEVPKVIAEQAASSINWTLVAIFLIAVVAGLSVWKFHRRQFVQCPGVK